MDEADHENFKQEIQGFLDDQDNFLDRKQAFIYAAKVGQIARNLDPKLYQGSDLFSEDLW
jgi:hypothetical protein